MHELKTVCFRCDASPQIGLGHFMRCFALAEHLKENHWKVAFIMTETTLMAKEYLESANIELYFEPHKCASSRDVNWTREILKERKATWVVIDGYVFDESYWGALGRSNFKTMVIDDEGTNEPWEPDLILNQNIHATREIYPKVKDSAKTLFGSRHALLRRQFRTMDSGAQKKSAKKQILITFGGGNHIETFYQVLDACVSIKNSEVEFLILLGGHIPYREKIKERCKAFQSSYRIIDYCKEISQLIKDSYLAISGSGSTCWEFCCLGLPSILITFADNQIPIARAIQQEGAGIYLSPHKNLSKDKLQTELNRLIQNSGERNKMSKKATCLVDGKGVQRVQQLLEEEIYEPSTV